jgi:hypothetical protein
MTKNQTPSNDPYVKEDKKPNSKFQNWISSRPAKITAISIGAALALGVAFTGGALAGRELLGGHDGPGFAKNFDHDGDHKPPFDGNRPPKAGHQFDGDQDGNFKFDGGQPPAPSSTPSNTP